MIFLQLATLVACSEDHAGRNGTSLGGTSLGGTSLGGTSLGGTSLGGTSLGGTSLGGTSLGGTSLGGTSLGGTSLGGTSLGGTSLGGTSLGGTSLGGTSLGGTSLGGTSSRNDIATAPTAGMGGMTLAGGSTATPMPTGGYQSSTIPGQGGHTGGTVSTNPAQAGSSAGGNSSLGAGGNQAGTTTVGDIPVSAVKTAEVQMALSGLTIVSYGGYLNGESFQQEGILTYSGYQYTAFWNDKRNIVLARRQLPSGSWQKFDFVDYANSANDAHNTISLGIVPADGTMHVSFDHHSSTLHYRRSVENLVTDPQSAVWAASSFPGGVSNALVDGASVTQVTYPRFVTEPGGQKMLFSARIGTSGSGDEYLWEYSATTHGWVSLGRYIDGITDNMNAYLHGLAYTRGGTRLHASWCWRDTPDASTNHDLLYVYSDDHGRTWKNNAGSSIGTSGTTAIRVSSNGLSVWPLKTRRGLINQEHMAIDSRGQVHVLLSHMPDSEADDATFTSARTKSKYFHYFRDGSGTWTRNPIAGLAVIQNFRGKLAVASSNNVYAVLPGLRIAGASAKAQFVDWALLTTDTSHPYFSDPLIDSARLEVEDKLTVYYPQAPPSKNIWTLDYTLQ